MTHPDHTQGRQLILLLKKRGYTTMELQQSYISTCPWKRVNECLRENEQLVKTKRERPGKRWIYVYRVVNKKA